MLALFSLVKQAYAAELDLGDKFFLNDNGDKVKDIYSKPTDLVNIIVPNLMVVGGIIIMFMFIMAAFKFMGDSSKGKEEAMGIMKTALIGFVLMFAAFWIVQIVKVITGTDINL